MFQAHPLRLLSVLLFLVTTGAPGVNAPEQDSGLPKTECLKVLNWNVLYGFDHGRAVDAGTAWIRGQRPDVLALQELNGFTHESFQITADGWGHAHAALQKEGGFAMGLSSTAPIEVIERKVEGFHHGYLHCKTHGIHFLVVHFWPGKGHEVDAVLAKAGTLMEQGASVMVLGDYNSHSPHDAAYLADTAVEPRFESVIKTEKAGLVDLVHRHDQSAHYSCPSPITIPEWSKDLDEVRSKRQRIDFLFTDAELAAASRRATIVQSEPLEEISDHYPLVAEFLMLPTEGPSPAPELRFGAIADCQYCAAEARGQRLYAQSAKKLQECVADLEELELDFVVHLGDLIDRDFESFDVVLPIFQGLTCPKHQVLGNHDFEVADEHKAEVPGRLGMPDRTYDFPVQGWRFVVLDGNDISLHAHPKESAEYEAATRYRAQLAPEAADWNGAMGPQQLRWLDSVLASADEANERVVLLSHFPVFPSDRHNLWNAEEVLALIDRHPCVKIYLNGHNHAGHYGVRNGVHFLTLKGMVDTEVTSYAVLEVHAEHVLVRGFGRENDRVLTLR